MGVGGKKGPKSDINITPYIDILLVLLIIFMVISPVEQMDLKIKVPQDVDQPTNEVDPNVIVLNMSENAKITINGDEFKIGQLSGQLQEIYSKRSNKALFIQAARSLAYDDVVHIIDIAKGAGVGDIGLITEEIN